MFRLVAAFWFQVSLFLFYLQVNRDVSSKELLVLMAYKPSNIELSLKRFF